MLSRLVCVAERPIEDQSGGGAPFELVANFNVSDARRVAGLVRNVKNRNISIAVAQTGRCGASIVRAPEFERLDCNCRSASRKTCNRGSQTVVDALAKLPASKKHQAYSACKTRRHSALATDRGDGSLLF